MKKKPVPKKITITELNRNLVQVQSFLTDTINQLKIAHQHDMNYLRKAIQNDMKTHESFYELKANKLDEKMKNELSKFETSLTRLNSKIDRVALQVSENVNEIKEISKTLKLYHLKTEILLDLPNYLEKKFASLETWNQEKIVLRSQVDMANADNRKQDIKIGDHEIRITDLEGA